MGWKQAILGRAGEALAGVREREVTRVRISIAKWGKVMFLALSLSPFSLYKLMTGTRVPRPRRRRSSFLSRRRRPPAANGHQPQ